MLSLPIDTAQQPLTHGESLRSAIAFLAHMADGSRRGHVATTATSPELARANAAIGRAVRSLESWFEPRASGASTARSRLV